MTSYLWYSADQEDFRRGRDLGDAFNRGRSASTGFCIYLDSFGEPVKITEVCHDPQPPSGYSDLRLVDTVEEDNCLVSTSGVMEKHAKEFCEKKNIAPTLTGLLQYIFKRDQTANYLRRDIKVGRAFRLKKQSFQG